MIYEVTGEKRFLDKATPMSGILLRGQNPDGMASAGTVLDVEMDHVDQFAQDELVKLYGERGCF